MKSKMTLPPIDKSWYFGFFFATALYLIVFGIYSILQPAKNYHALHLIDKSIKHANEIIDEGSDYKVYKLKSELYNNIKPIVDALDSSPNKIKGLLNKINALRVRITEESGGLYSLKEHQLKWEDYGYEKFVFTTDSTKDGIAVGFDNKSVVRRILIGEKEGESLKTEIIKTRAALLAVVDRLYDSLDKKPIKGIKLDSKAIEELKKDLVLVLPTDDLSTNNKNFAEFTFGNLSVLEANLILRKFEIDAEVACAQIVNFFIPHILTQLAENPSKTGQKNIF